MKILSFILLCAGGLLFASCDSGRTDTNAENIVTEDTPLDQTNTPVPPPPTGTNPASDRGPGTGPGTGAVQTGEYDGGNMIDNDTIRAGGTQGGGTGSGVRDGIGSGTGTGSRR